MRLLWASLQHSWLSRPAFLCVPPVVRWIWIHDWWEAAKLRLHDEAFFTGRKHYAVNPLKLQLTLTNKRLNTVWTQTLVIENPFLGQQRHHEDQKMNSISKLNKTVFCKVKLNSCFHKVLTVLGCSMRGWWSHTPIARTLPFIWLSYMNICSCILTCWTKREQVSHLCVILLQSVSMLLCLFLLNSAVQVAQYVRKQLLFKYYLLESN